MNGDPKTPAEIAPSTLRFNASLIRRVVDAGAGRRPVESCLARDIRRGVGTRDVETVDEIGAIERQRCLRRERRVLRLRPQHDARRRLRCDREHRRHPEWHAMEAGAALEVAPRIVALDRDLRQRRHAGLLEDDAQQHRPPIHGTVVFRRQRVDLLRGHVAVRRREIEVEVDGLAHGHPQMARPITSRWMSLVPS